MSTTPPAPTRLLHPQPGSSVPPAPHSAQAAFPELGSNISSAVSASAPPPAASPSSPTPSSQLQHRRVRRDSSDSEWSASEGSATPSARVAHPLLVSSSSSAGGQPSAAAAKQRAAFVRLVGGWWPLPLRSNSTYACLFGLSALCLVLVDEVASHLRRQHLQSVQQQEQSIFSPTSLFPGLAKDPPLLHVLRHSFLYRCLLCLAWLLAVLAHGLFLHRNHKRGGGNTSSGVNGSASGRKRRSVGSSNEASTTATLLATPQPQLQQSYRDVVKKSVSFARRGGSGGGGDSSAEEGSPSLRPLSSADSGLAAAALSLAAPSARPATRKRLRFFFVLALLLALCGVAFELWLALVSDGTVAVPPSKVSVPAAATELWSELHTTFAKSFSWSAALSILSRLLLLSLWCGLCAAVCWVAWYRKAVGVRRTRGPVKRKAVMDAVSEDAEDEDEEEDMEDEATEDAEAAAQEQADKSNVAEGRDIAASSAVASSSAAASPASLELLDARSAASVASAAVAQVDSLAGGLSSDESDFELDSDEESYDGGLTPRDSPNDGLAAGPGAASSATSSNASSFPVPSAAALLLAEKLDASLFFHPEQEQNRYDLQQQPPLHAAAQEGADRGRKPSVRAGASTTNSPSVPAVYSSLRRASDSGLSLAPPSSSYLAAASLARASTTSPPSSSAAASSQPLASPRSSTLSTAASPVITPPLNLATLFHLASTKFIHALSGEDFAVLLPELSFQQRRKGEIIYSRGERTGSGAGKEDGSEQQEDADGMFIVVSGTVGALNEPRIDSAMVSEGNTNSSSQCDVSQPPQILATFHQGDALGELEFLFPHLPRTHTMRALTPVSLLRIPTRLGRLWNASSASSAVENAVDGDQQGSNSEDVAAASLSASFAPPIGLSSTLFPTTAESPPSFAAPPPSSVSSANAMSSLSPPAMNAAGDTSLLARCSAPGPLRSDILLSYVRTTLARQWRSAEFVLEKFLHVPLSQEFVQSVRQSSGGPLAAATSCVDGGDAVPAASASPFLSRYFSPSFTSFFPAESPLLQALAQRSSQQCELSPGQTLYEEGAYRSDQLFVVLSGSVQLTSSRPGERSNEEQGPGSVLNAIAFLTDTTHAHTCRASQGSSPVRLAWITQSELSSPNSEVLLLALEVCRVLAPTLLQFHALGFQRSWLRAGTLVFAEGQKCDALHVIQAGRVRIVTGKMKRLAKRGGAAAGNRKAATAGTQCGTGASPHKRRSATSSSSSVGGPPPHPSGLDLSVFSEAPRYASVQHTAGGVGAAAGASARAQANAATTNSVSGSVGGAPSGGLGLGGLQSHTGTGSSKSAGPSRIKFELATGELIGEMSFFACMGEDGGEEVSDMCALTCSSTQPSACATSTHGSTALCVKDSELIKISRPAFANLVRRYPRTLIKLLSILSKRMRDLMSSGGLGGGGSSGSGAGTGATAGQSLLSSVPRSPFLRTPSSGSSNATSVCLLTSSPSVPLHDFALSLSVSLSRHGRTMLLTHAHVDRVLGAGTCQSLHNYHTRSLLSYWLAHVEAHYAFLLFVADSEVSAWTRQCTRQAELTLIVAHAEGGVGSSTVDGPAGDAANANAAAAAAADRDEDDDDDDLDESELTPSEQRARRRREAARIKRVSKFERIVVWEEGASSVLQQPGASKRSAAARAEALRAAAAAAAVNPSSRNGGLTLPPPALASAFSPTLHSSPPPTDDLAPAPLTPSAALSSSSSSSATPGVSSAVTGNYHLCAPRMNFALRDLVLLHPPTTTMPRGTRFWLSARPNLHRFHHVQQGTAEHMDRLARYIAGKTVGVCLSGGGARGLAHLGVLTSFAEQGVPIDYVGGTSQGSFMAALYASQACHHTAALSQMAARVHALAERMGSIRALLSDATFPMLSYFAGEKFGANISALLGPHTRIEDLWIGYFLVTTNLSQADMCVHETGRLWKAVRASMTVLDYLPPMQMSRAWPDLLIDGGYTNNLPVDVMHGLFQPCFVIGVDVENKAAEEKLTRVSYFGAHLSGWWLARKRISEWLKGGWVARTMNNIRSLLTKQPKDTVQPFFHLPKFAELVGSLVYINHNRNLRQSLQGSLLDLYIRPELGSTALLDYHLESSVVAIGYACTKVKLTEWRLRNSALLPKATPPPAGAQSGLQAVVTGSPAMQPAQAASPGSALATPLPAAASHADLSALAGSSAVSSSGGLPALSRRKTSIGSSTARPLLGVAFVPPPSLTFTHDRASLVSATATASPMHRGQAVKLASPAAGAATAPAPAAATSSSLGLARPQLHVASSEWSLAQASEHAAARSAALAEGDENAAASADPVVHTPQEAVQQSSSQDQPASGLSILAAMQQQPSSGAKQPSAQPSDTGSDVPASAAATTAAAASGGRRRSQSGANSLDDSLVASSSSHVHTTPPTQMPLRRLASESSAQDTD